MTSLRAVIVDDERLGREKIRAMLAPHDDVALVAECATANEALAEIRKRKPDLVFLDVQMPGSDGFEMLRRLKVEPMPAVIFVTAHDRYALEAFDIDAVDYLLKPFDRRRFNEALRRARKRIETGNTAVADTLRMAIEQLSRKRWTRFVVKSRDRMTFVPAAQVDWIEAEGKYVRLHAGAATHLVREAIAEVERRLDPAEFARVHRGAIVNLRSVAEMHRGVGGDYVVVLRNGARVAVSRRYWSKLKHLGGVT